MNKNYGLTNTELQIMELLWKENRPMAFREIMEVARNQWKKECADLKYISQWSAKDGDDSGRAGRGKSLQ